MTMTRAITHSPDPENKQLPGPVITAIDNCADSTDDGRIYFPASRNELHSQHRGHFVRRPPLPAATWLPAKVDAVRPLGTFIRTENDSAKRGNDHELDDPGEHPRSHT
ncbi:hypothetical protein GCM10022419_115570 [Nonomuraea rosea]|uniref:ATP-grasp-modified RiPP n=1 Tax=Nonomuraea rosea TaxID=638574 RepID=A0ABP6ZKA1_9ACTN